MRDYEIGRNYLHPESKWENTKRIWALWVGLTSIIFYFIGFVIFMQWLWRIING